jgi:hypothetical protein
VRQKGRQQKDLTVVGISRSGCLGGGRNSQCFLNLGGLLAMRLLFLLNVANHIRDTIREDLEAHMGLQLSFRQSACISHLVFEFDLTWNSANMLAIFSCNRWISSLSFFARGMFFTVRVIWVRTWGLVVPGSGA